MPPRSRRWRPLTGLLSSLLLGGALLGARPATASLLMPLDTAQLVARAERVVVGTVLGQQSRWTDDHSTIVTDVRVRVTTAMMGAKEGEVITVRRLGGTVGEVGMKVFGEASFSDGEEVLLFAERRGDSLFSVGMTQGTLHVVTEGGRPEGRKLAHAALAGAELLGRPGAQAAPPAGPRPLEEVVQEVRGAIAARAAQQQQRKATPEVKR